MTGCVRPPKKLQQLVDQPALRGVAGDRASKMCALPIFLTRRIAFLPSSR